MAETIDDTNTFTIELTQPAPPAKGQLVSMDAPARAEEGATVLISGSAKNIGGASGNFSIDVFDGTTRVVGDGSAAATVAPGETFGFNNVQMVMPARTVTLTFKVMRY